jgi:hypothetical protein
MSASAVRGGQVYIEIGADSSRAIAALGRINAVVGKMGGGLAKLGTSFMAAGTAIVAPIMAAGMAFSSQNEEVLRAQKSLLSLGESVGQAVAPAIVGVANAIAGMADAAARFVRDNEQLVRQVLAVGGALVGVGALMFGFGKTMSVVSFTIANFSKPLMAVMSIVMALAGPALAVAAALGGIAFAANAAGVDLGKLAQSAGALGGVFAGPINDAKALLADLGETTSTTISGIYNSIAAGDIAGAIDILWAGVNAAWLRGQAAIMGVIDPFLTGILNVFDYLKTNVVNNVDSLQTDSAAVFRTLSAMVMGVFDNLKNSILATFDAILAGIKTAWVRIQDYLTGATDTEQKIAAIEADTKQRAADRGKSNPGIEKRMADAAIANQMYEGAAISRQTTNRQKSDDRMAGRVDADRQRAADRMAAVEAAKTALDQKVASTSAPDEIKKPKPETGSMSTSIAGTFSAFGVGQMAGGNVQKLQLDESMKQTKLLEKIASGEIIA